MECLEFERKQLLTKESYEKKLVELYKMERGQNYIQVNYYYDTTFFDMFNKNETVRVRLKDSGLKLEYKLHRYYVNKTRICKEISIGLSNIPKKIIIGNHILHLIGSMVTMRTDFKINSYLISLDKNYYLGKIDYEIEVESKNTDNISIDLLNSLSNDFVSVGKYSRFVATLRELDNAENLIIK